MKSLQLFDRLRQKSCYENFSKDNPNAYLYAIFAMMSTAEKEGDKIQFDFFVEKNNKIGIAEYPFEEIKMNSQEINPKPKILNLNEISLDIEDLPQEVEIIQKEKKDKTNITKTIAILKENIWDLTCLTPTVDVLKIKINAQTKECLSFKKESLMNFIQIKKK